MKSRPLNSLAQAFQKEGLGRPCWPKEQHATEGAARAQLRSILKRGLHKNERLHVYRCPFCGSHHIGHGKSRSEG